MMQWMFSVPEPAEPVSGNRGQIELNAPMGAATSKRIRKRIRLGEGCWSERPSEWDVRRAGSSSVCTADLAQLRWIRGPEGGEMFNRLCRKVIPCTRGTELIICPGRGSTRRIADRARPAPRGCLLATSWAGRSGPLRFWAGNFWPVTGAGWNLSESNVVIPGQAAGQRI